MDNLNILFFGEFLLAIGLGIGGFFLYKTHSHYNRLTQIKKGENLQNILEEILTKSKNSQIKIQEIVNELGDIKKESKLYVQKASIFRYNPFEDTGGDQSFIVSILDGHDDGIVLTSLHQRGVMRWYAKNVRGGKGVDHELSKEELQAIKKAGREGGKNN